MASLRIMVFVLLVLCFLARPSEATVYEVGWSTASRYDDVAEKILHVGDALKFIFEHRDMIPDNVVQVNQAAYDACDASSPIATFLIGNDIPINVPGNLYYISGNPNRCQQGERIAIPVRGSNAMIMPSTPTTTSVPTTPSGAVRGEIGFDSAVGLCVAVVYGLFVGI